jgi:hypothetical protein
MVIAQVLEAAMLICFGLSWPINAYKILKQEQPQALAGNSFFLLLLDILLALPQSLHRA